MGQGDEIGILPRFCEELFERIKCWKEVNFIFPFTCGRKMRFVFFKKQFKYLKKWTVISQFCFPVVVVFFI